MDTNCILAERRAMNAGVRLTPRPGGFIWKSPGRSRSSGSIVSRNNSGNRCWRQRRRRWPDGGFGCGWSGSWGGVGTVCAAKVVAGAGPSRLVYAVHLHCVCTKKEASLPAQGDTSSCSQTENVHTKPESRSKDSKERVLHRRRCTSRQPWMIETGKHAVVQLLASRHSERRRFECALF